MPHLKQKEQRAGKVRCLLIFLIVKNRDFSVWVDLEREEARIFIQFPSRMRTNMAGTETGEGKAPEHIQKSRVGKAGKQGNWSKVTEQILLGLCRYGRDEQTIQQILNGEPGLIYCYGR